MRKLEQTENNLSIKFGRLFFLQLNLEIRIIVFTFELSKQKT